MKGARVVVVARFVEKDFADTPQLGRTTVVGADVVVVAVHGCRPFADTESARVILRALVAIITGFVDVIVHAVPRLRVAIFGRTGISIVAGVLLPTDTYAVFTPIIEGAWIAILARPRDGNVIAPNLRVAPIVGARIAVIARQNFTIALPLLALVVVGARIPVIAVRSVG